MKIFAAFILFLLFNGSAVACSTFLLSKNGTHVFGRNYDWGTGNGMMMVNARRVVKTSFSQEEGNTISWTSTYGSVTFNQFGKEFPHGGMNEKGLVVELMWLNETVYPKADSRAAVNGLQWIQYQLDNCATIEEVIATDKKIRINRTGAAPLHYLVADSRGHAATIEFIDGRMVVHQGDKLSYPVLTNTPYEDAAQIVKEGHAKGLDNSEQRFTTACSMVRQYQLGNSQQKPVDYAFNILDKIAQPGYTKWSIVYDITNLQVYCITDQRTQRKQVAFGDINFSCNGSFTALNLDSPLKGNVAKSFTSLSFEQNLALIKRSARESSDRVNVSDAHVAKAAEYYKQVHCR